MAKDQIAGKLAKTAVGPEFVHVPAGPNGTPIRGFDQHVIEEFTSESCTVRMVNGFKQHTWRKVGHRSNERLDCLVYALAALVLARVNRPEDKQRPTWGVQNSPIQW